MNGSDRFRQMGEQRLPDSSPGHRDTALQQESTQYRNLDRPRTEHFRRSNDMRPFHFSRLPNTRDRRQASDSALCAKLRIYIAMARTAEPGDIKRPGVIGVMPFDIEASTSSARLFCDLTTRQRIVQDDVRFWQAVPRAIFRSRAVPIVRMRRASDVPDRARSILPLRSTSFGTEATSLRIPGDVVRYREGGVTLFAASFFHAIHFITGAQR